MTRAASIRPKPGFRRWFLFSAALALIAGVTVLAAHRGGARLRAELLRQTRVIAVSICRERVAALRGDAADVDSPDYRYLKEHLAAIRAATPHCRFAYLMARQADGTVVFLVDSEPESSPDYSPPGQVYEEASAPLLAAFETGRAAIEGPVTDRWGIWVSSLAPLSLSDAEGNRVLLGLDVDARNWRGIVAGYAALPAALASIAILLGLLALWLYQSRLEIRIREATLQENRRRLNDLIDFLPDATLAIDREKRIVIWNKAIEKMTGIPAAEMIGKGPDAYTVPFYEEARPQLMDLAFENDATVAARYPGIRREGDAWVAETFCSALHDRRGAWVSAKASPLYDAGGRVVGAIECIRDTTEHKRAEDALRASEEKLSSLFESMDEMAVLHELVFGENGQPADYRLTDCNAAFIRITGISRENAVGRLASEVYGTGSAPYLEEYARAVQSNTSLHFETRFAPMDKYFMISAVPLGANRFATLSSDVTERRRSEEQVRKLLEDSNCARQALLGILEDQNQAQADLKRLATAIEQSAESIVVTDAKARIQYVNPAFEAVTGYSREEAIGQNPRILQSGQQDAAFYQAMWKALANGKTWQGRMVNRRKDGTLYTEDALISPVTDAAGQIVNYVAVKRDVTEQLRLAAQLNQTQRMESIGRLAGGVAHDFNNMLTVILGHTEMTLIRKDLDPALRNNLEAVHRAAMDSAAIVRQLQAFARKQAIAPRVIDLNPTVGGAIQMLQRLIGENVELVWRPAEALWPVKVDPAQIDQILVNLCANARDAIAGVGQIAIATDNVALDAAFCAAHLGAIPGEYARLTIRDTGGGMDPETLSHVFEPFYTTKAPGKGTGLGLPMVYGVVKQNGGYIDISSAPGQGTAVQIYLPRHGDAASAPPPAAPLSLPATDHKTILLVEDEPSVLAMTAEVLDDLGYAVRAAHSPVEAIRMAQEHRGEIHLLLTDVVMPGMNGRDLARTLRDLRPGLRFLFMSGYTADIIAHDGILDEGLNFLHKPFTKTALAAKIREVLEA